MCGHMLQNARLTLHTPGDWLYTSQCTHTEHAFVFMLLNRHSTGCQGKRQKETEKQAREFRSACFNEAVTEEVGSDRRSAP
jgi:hypothetical protein